MSYGLVPRITKDGRIFWDDPDRLVYDVVCAVPLSTPSDEERFTTARVTVRRDYLEDYLSLKDCAAIATYFDERYSLNDPEVASLIGKHGVSFKQTGRELWFLPLHGDDANQASQVWACALLLSPTHQPITTPPERELTWPDRNQPIRGRGIDTHFEVFETCFVRDEVLANYEKRPEFEINPESGSVSYDGRWFVGYGNRVGRNFIELELRKLYEGAPFDVIKHYNGFAVKTGLAEKDTRIFGTKHIGARAKDLIREYLSLTETISDFSEQVGLVFTQEDVGGLSKKQIEYAGWWTFADLKTLGHTAPVGMARAEFLHRCAEVFKLLENLRVAPLRQILLRLGLKKDSIADFANLKLLAALCQLAKISKEGGFHLASDHSEASASWNAKTILSEFKPLFALFGLRVSDTARHTASDQGGSCERARGVRDRPSPVSCGVGRRVGSGLRRNDRLNSKHRLHAGLGSKLVISTTVSELTLLVGRLSTPDSTPTTHVLTVYTPTAFVYLDPKVLA